MFACRSIDATTRQSPHLSPSSRRTHQLMASKYLQFTTCIKYTLTTPALSQKIIVQMYAIIAPTSIFNVAIIVVSRLSINTRSILLTNCASTSYCMYIELVNTHVLNVRIILLASFSSLCNFQEESRRMEIEKKP